MQQLQANASEQLNHPHPCLEILKWLSQLCLHRSNWTLGMLRLLMPLCLVLSGRLLSQSVLCLWRDHRKFCSSCRQELHQMMDTLFELRSLTGTRLANILPPLVPDVEVLANEGSAMGDDELNCTCGHAWIFLVGLMFSTWIRCWLWVGWRAGLLTACKNGRGSSLSSSALSR